MSQIDRIRSDPSFAQRFEIQDRLGAGGMGEVYRGVQKALGRQVAIKILSAELENGSDFADRFVQEAKLAAGVIHSGVVVVFDYGIAAGKPYLVSELVEGRSLAALLAQRGRLQLAEILSIAGDVLDGLGAIHKRGIVHRDLKPENVLLNGEVPPRAKITDFGIAKNVAEGPHTRSGVVLGTPAYLAPEQAVGDAVSPATDLYAFSVILHRMVTGRAVFAAKTALELIHLHIHQAPELGPEIDGDLREFLAHGLAKDPRARISSAKEYRERLDAAGRSALARGTFLKGVRGPASGARAGPPAASPTAGAIPTTVTAVAAPTSRTEVAKPVRTGRRALAGAGAVALAFATLAFLATRAPVRAPEASVHATPASASASAVPARDAAVLFAHIRSAPRLASLPLDSVAADAGARAVDEALLDLIESGMAGAFPARAAGPGGAELIARLSDSLRCDNNQDLLAADRLLDVFFAGASPDERALHPGNALRAIHAVLEIRSARNPPEMADGLHRALLAALAHPNRPLGRWAHACASGALTAAGLKPPAELGAAPTADDGGATRWPHLDAVFAEQARWTRDRWQTEPALPAVRKAVLLVQLFVRLDELERPGHRWTRSWSVPHHVALGRLRAALVPEGHLRDTKPSEIVAHLEGQLETGAREVSFSSNLTSGLVAWLGYQLQVRWPELADAVQADEEGRSVGASPTASPSPTSVAGEPPTTGSSLDEDTALDVLEAALTGKSAASSDTARAALTRAGQALAGESPDFAQAHRVVEELVETRNKGQIGELPGTVWTVYPLLSALAEDGEGAVVYNLRSLEHNAHHLPDHALGAWGRRTIGVLVKHIGAYSPTPMPAGPDGLDPAERWPAMDRLVRAAARRLDAKLSAAGAPRIRRAVLLTEILIRHGEAAAGKGWIETDGAPWNAPLAKLLSGCGDPAMRARIEAEHPAADIDPTSQLSSGAVAALARCAGVQRPELIERVARENAVPHPEPEQGASSPESR